MRLKLERDDTRMIQQNFLPYLDRLTENKVQHQSYNPDEWLNCKVIRSLFVDIKKKIDRKLLTDANRFKFKFSDAEGITLYKLLMNMPVNKEQVYMMQLRSTICDTLHKQMCEPT